MGYYLARKRNEPSSHEKTWRKRTHIRTRRGYTQRDSNRAAFWRRRNRGDGEQSRGRQGRGGLWGGRGIDSEAPPYDRGHMSSDICPDPRTVQPPGSGQCLRCRPRTPGHHHMSVPLPSLVTSVPLWGEMPGTGDSVYVWGRGTWGKTFHSVLLST